MAEPWGPRPRDLPFALARYYGRGLDSPWRAEVSGALDQEQTFQPA